MSSSIATITPTGSNAAHVLVDAAYADSLNQFIHSKGITVHPPQEAVSRTVRAFVDDKGRKQVILETTDMTFMAQATPAQLEPIVGEWLKTLGE